MPELNLDTPPYMQCDITGKVHGTQAHVDHVLALLTCQQPTFQKLTRNQLGIYFQMPCLYLRQYNASFVSSQILKCRLWK